MEETNNGGNFGAAKEAKEYLAALSPKMQNEGVYILIFGPERSPLGDSMKTQREIAIDEAERITSPSLTITLSNLAFFQERVETWSSSIDQDIRSYGGRGKDKWKITKGKKYFSMARRFIW